VNRPYRAAIRRVDLLIDSGNSLSGHEPNCAFLNLGNDTFATVSALSGFDFPDDARALALIDWDMDGDLDVWTTNRTAPGIRYLRNDLAGDNHSLLLRLEGTNACRDAPGARAEVRVKGQPDKPLIRTVKYGEGFLGQSSRWLHFGLGGGDVIESVRVTWPGGRTEIIEACRPDTAVTFTEGDLFPQSTALARREQPADASPLEVRSAEFAGAVTLFHPVPFPPLPAIDPDGKSLTVSDSAGPLLINVFASWCPDCIAELTAWRDAADSLGAAGLSVTVLSADGRDSAHSTGPQEAWAWLKENRIPFPAGILTDEAFRRLNASHRNLFGAIVSLPVPSSFLLDGGGRLAAVYRGPVSVRRILADAATAADDEASARTSAALPFHGRWLHPPDPPDPSFWLNDLVSRQSLDEAFAFFGRHTAALRRHKDFVLMAGALGDKLSAVGRHAAAITAFEAALTKSPDSPGVLNNLASLYAVAPDKSLRHPSRALELAQKAVSLTSPQSPAVLDTLAAAHAANGNFNAAADVAAKALALARSQNENALIPILSKALAAYRAGRLPE
jgi:tetratricopeptide (TPR) repeat protein